MLFYPKLQDFHLGLHKYCGGIHHLLHLDMSKKFLISQLSNGELPITPYRCFTLCIPESSIAILIQQFFRLTFLVYNSLSAHGRISPSICFPLEKSRLYFENFFPVNNQAISVMILLSIL